MLKIKKIFLDLLFPVSCFNCGRGNQLICQECSDKFLKLLGNNTNAGDSCQYLTKVLVAFDYNNQLVARAIRAFKYNFIFDLADILGSLLVEFLKSQNLKNFDLVIPVPLNIKRKNWRGFNQAELLARIIGQYYLLPVENDLLIRRVNTHPQVGLSAKQRQTNISGIFCIKKEYILKNKKILLVDDVITTGATLNECAKLLINNGAKEVWAAALAKD